MRRATGMLFLKRLQALLFPGGLTFDDEECRNSVTCPFFSNLEGTGTPSEEWWRGRESLPSGHAVGVGGERPMRWRSADRAKRGMVERKGIEPSTPTLRTSCSPN